MKSSSTVSKGVQIALAVIAILLGMWLIYRLGAVVVLIMVAVVLTTGIDPVVTQMEQWRLPRGWHMPRGLAIALVLLGAFLVLGGILLYIGSVAWTEGSVLVNNAPEYAAQVQAWLANLSRRYPQIPPLEDLVTQAQQQLGQIGAYALQTTAAVFGVLGGLASTATILVLTFYMTLEKASLQRAIYSFIPPAQHDTLGAALAEASRKMGGWLRGQLLLAIIVVVIVTSVMAVLGMPYPFLLGMIGGLGEIAPLIGPIIAAVFAIPIALLTQPLWVTIVVTIFFIVFSQIEGNWLVPRIMKSSVDLSPLLTLVALLVGAGLLGLLGALLAIPLAAGLRVLVIRLVIPAIQNSGQEQAGARVYTPLPEPVREDTDEAETAHL